MKKIIFNILIIFVFITAFSIDFSPEMFKELADNKNEKPIIKIPTFTRTELNNGMIIYLIEDNSLPIIEMTGFIKGGLSFEDDTNAGITSIMVQMMNKGNKNYSESDFSKFKELNGLSLSMDVKNDYISFEGNALSPDKEKMVDLLKETLINVDFNKDYLLRVLQESYAYLMQARTNEDSISKMYFYKNIYNDIPYSYQYDLNQILMNIQTVTPDKIMAHYNKSISPDKIIVAISGDFETKKMLNYISNSFSDWNKKSSKIPEFERKDNSQLNNKILLINKPDSTQANIIMGYNFYKKNEFKDRIPFTIANQIYGSGDFQCRLMKELRTNKGLVYGVYSNFTENINDGVFSISTTVRPEKTFEARKDIIKIMNDIKENKNPINEDEVFQIVNIYNALLPSSLNDKISIIRSIISSLDLNKERLDYMNYFINEYNKLNAEKVQKSFVENTYPEKFFTVIVGNKEQILPEFQKNGIDIDIIDLN